MFSEEGLTAANGVDDFDDVAGLKIIAFKVAARNNVAIDLHGQPLSCQPHGFDKCRCCKRLLHIPCVAIDYNLHGVEAVIRENRILP